MPHPSDHIMCFTLMKLFLSLYYYNSCAHVGVYMCACYVCMCVRVCVYVYVFVRVCVHNYIMQVYEY